MADSKWAELADCPRFLINTNQFLLIPVETESVYTNNISATIFGRKHIRSDLFIIIVHKVICNLGTQKRFKA